MILLKGFMRSKFIQTVKIATTIVCFVELMFRFGRIGKMIQSQTKQKKTSPT